MLWPFDSFSWNQPMPKLPSILFITHEIISLHEATGVKKNVKYRTIKMLSKNKWLYDKDIFCIEMNIVHLDLLHCSSVVQCFSSMLETLGFIFNINNNNNTSNKIIVFFLMPVLWHTAHTSRLFVNSPWKS